MQLDVALDDVSADESARVVQLGALVADDLLGLCANDTLLLVVDEAGWSENGDIAAAILSSGRKAGAEAILVQIDDAVTGTDGHHVEYLPDAVAMAMEGATALVSLTRTTSAPLPHHHVPISLVRANKLRGVFMVKRSRTDLLGDSVLGVDFAFMDRVAKAWQTVFESGSSVRVTNAAGTDLRASIEGMPSHRSNFAHDPGGLCPINWGEVYQGPVVGTAEGIVVVDGPILGYGWPESPVTVHIEAGLAVDIEGPSAVVDPLWRLVQSVENGSNVAELALGINPRANDAGSTNVFKKGLGRLHIALGNGLVYDQGVDSEIHIDFVLPTPTVAIDAVEIIVNGRPVDSAFDVMPSGRALS